MPLFRCCEQQQGQLTTTGDVLKRHPGVVATAKRMDLGKPGRMPRSSTFHGNDPPIHRDSNSDTAKLKPRMG